MLFHGNNGYANESQYYVIRTLHVIQNLAFYRSHWVGSVDLDFLQGEVWPGTSIKRNRLLLALLLHFYFCLVLGNSVKKVSSLTAHTWILCVKYTIIRFPRQRTFQPPVYLEGGILMWLNLLHSNTSLVDWITVLGTVLGKACLLIYLISVLLLI